MDLPTTIPQDIREYWEIIKKADLGHPESVSLFFRLALQGFYSPMSNGMNSGAGHILYRLSDHLSREERENINVYGDDSLEDWRKEWQSQHPIIPILTVKLLSD